MPYKFLLSCLLALSCKGLIAQEYSMLHFTTRDGLPNNSISSIAQDKEGFIWMGTETGVCRFDGSSFKNYTVKDGLPSNNIYCIFVDSKNRVWLTPFKEEICYYYQGKIYNKKNSPLIRKIPVSGENISYAEDDQGMLLLQTRKHNVFILPNDSCIIYPFPLGQRDFFTRKLINRKFKESLVSTSLNGYYSNHRLYYHFNESSDHPLIAINEGQHIRVFSDEKTISLIPIPKHVITGYPISDSLFIFNTKQGSFIYRIMTGELIDTLIKDVSINHTRIDDEGGRWIGTDGSGLYYIPAGTNLSVTHTPDNIPLQVLNFYCTAKGLFISCKDSRFRQINKATYRLVQDNRNADIPVESFILPKGNVWKPATDPILLKKVKQVSPISTPFIKSVSNLHDSLLIATTYNLALVPLNKANKRNKGNFREIWKTRSTCAYFLNENYYVGSLDGLYTFPEDGTAHNKENSKLLINGVIVSIAWSWKSDLLWVITSDNGVYCLDSRGFILRNINESNGLSGNICKCIFTDGEIVYIGTNNGLNVIEPEKNFLITKLYTLDGLASDDINCVYAEGNKVWAGTSAGYSVIDMPSIRTQADCRLVMTGIDISGRSIPVHTNDLILKPKDNNIKFSYSGISFSSMGKIKYTYRLNGLSDQWNVTAQQTLDYPSLPAGNYTLEIFATNRFNIKSPVLKIPFLIRQYWWQYWWVHFCGFIVMLALIALILYRMFAKTRLRQQEKNRLKTRVMELEQLALRAQMNPHFIFNSLNSFYQYVINRDLVGASKFMNDFSTLIRLLFEISSLKEISLDKEIFFLTTYLNMEQTKLNHSFLFSFHIQENLITEDINIPTFILQPFIENSIRHGIAGLKDRKGRVDISIIADEKNITVRIEDNGVGRKYTREQKSKQVFLQHSKGITLTEERIELYNQTERTKVEINVVDKHAGTEATGTLVNIHFPIKKGHD